jgi:hypothetical protein
LFKNYITPILVPTFGVVSLITLVPFFTKKYGTLLRLSGQGIEKINDDIANIHHSKSNKWDATVDVLQVRKRIEHLTSENCERDKRNYTEHGIQDNAYKK